MQTVFDCGCSHLKVKAGQCDTYDERGELRRVAGGEPDPDPPFVRRELQQRAPVTDPRATLTREARIEAPRQLAEAEKGQPIGSFVKPEDIITPSARYRPTPEQAHASPTCVALAAVGATEAQVIDHLAKELRGVEQKLLRMLEVHGTPDMPRLRTGGAAQLRSDEEAAADPLAALCAAERSLLLAGEWREDTRPGFWLDREGCSWPRPAAIQIERQSLEHKVLTEQSEQADRDTLKV